MQTADPYTLLLERVRALEVIVANLRDELAELRAGVWDAGISDIGAALDEDDPEGWLEPDE